MKKFTIQERITSRECDSLDMYLKDISNDRYNPISQEQETELVLKIRNGDNMAMTKLVNANIRFAVSVAKSYQGNGLSLSDLINEANIGLIKATEKFDETRGFKFISYAVWWIRQSILQSISGDSKTIRLPMNQVNNMSRINKVYQDMEQELGRSPSTSEIADKLSISERDVALVNLHKSKMRSFSSPINDEESSTLEDVIEDSGNYSDSLLMQDSLKKEIKKALDLFSDRDQEVIRLSFGIDKDYPMDDQEIADNYKLTRERIRQIKKNVSRTLKTNYELKSFLG